MSVLCLRRFYLPKNQTISFCRYLQRQPERKGYGVPLRAKTENEKLSFDGKHEAVGQNLLMLTFSTLTEPFIFLFFDMLEGKRTV